MVPKIFILTFVHHYFPSLLLAITPITLSKSARINWIFYTLLELMKYKICDENFYHVWAEYRTKFSIFLPFNSQCSRICYFHEQLMPRYSRFLLIILHNTEHLHHTNNIILNNYCQFPSLERIYFRLLIHYVQSHKKRTKSSIKQWRYI